MPSRLLALGVQVSQQLLYQVWVLTPNIVAFPWIALQIMNNEGLNTSNALFRF